METISEHADIVGRYLVSTVFIEGCFETAIFADSSWDELHRRIAVSADDAAINHNAAFALAAQLNLLES